MRIKGNLSYIRLLVPVLLFAGAQIFAQTAADSRMPAAYPASHKPASLHADVSISDRAFLMKSTDEILYESAMPNCSSGIYSVGDAKSFFSGGCGKIDCAAPPPGCFYQKPAATDQNGCPINCGTLVCGPEQ
jgi:hypothetical protein